MYSIIVMGASVSSPISAPVGLTFAQAPASSPCSPGYEGAFMLLRSGAGQYICTNCVASWPGVGSTVEAQEQGVYQRGAKLPWDATSLPGPVHWLCSPSLSLIPK